MSPHLDDASFSCGTLIAACGLFTPALVVSVLAGFPEDEAEAEKVAVRRQEDARALGLLGADYLHLDVLDGLYGRDSAPEARLTEVRAALAPVLADAGVVFGPWGIRHPDHLLVAEALRGRADYLYEELPYRVLWSEYLPHDLPAPALELPFCAVKRAAVECYQSQLGGPPGEALFAAERYHRAVR